VNHGYHRRTYRNEDVVFLDAGLLEPFSNTPEASACGLPNRWIFVLETVEYEGPQFVHVRAHKLGASFHDNAQC